jgi:hypothetical protein
MIIVKCSNEQCENFEDEIELDVAGNTTIVCGPCGTLIVSLEEVSSEPA